MSDGLSQHVSGLLDEVLRGTSEPRLLVPCGSNPWTSEPCIGFDPFRRNTDRAAMNAARMGVDSVFAVGAADQIPFADYAFGTVVAPFLFSTTARDLWSQVATELVRLRRFDGVILVVEGERPEVEGELRAAPLEVLGVDAVEALFEGLGLAEFERWSTGGLWGLRCA